MKKRTMSLALVGLALSGVLLVACSGIGSPGGMNGMNHGTSSAPATSSPNESFNEADEMFTLGMIAHHQQAVEMADLLLGKGGVDERVRQIAQQIKDAQQPEIDQMNSWLEQHNITSDTGMGHMGHDMGGTMTDDDMSALEKASGSEASSLFLEQMIEHHQGAIAMAKTELADGETADARKLAQTIIDDQSAEITEMRELLSRL